MRYLFLLVLLMMVFLNLGCRQAKSADTQEKVKKTPTVTIAEEKKEIDAQEAFSVIHAGLTGFGDGTITAENRNAVQSLHGLISKDGVTLTMIIPEMITKKNKTVVIFNEKKVKNYSQESFEALILEQVEQLNFFLENDGQGPDQSEDLIDLFMFLTEYRMDDDGAPVKAGDNCWTWDVTKRFYGNAAHKVNNKVCLTNENGAWKLREVTMIWSRMIGD